MCIICDEFKSGKLTIGEAIRNYGEMRESITVEHQKEVEETLFNNFPFYPPMFDEEYWETTGFGD